MSGHRIGTAEIEAALQTGFFFDFFFNFFQLDNELFLFLMMSINIGSSRMF